MRSISISLIIFVLFFSIISHAGEKSKKKWLMNRIKNRIIKIKHSSEENRHYPTIIIDIYCIDGMKFVVTKAPIHASQRGTGVNIVQIFDSNGKPKKCSITDFE